MVGERDRRKEEKEKQQGRNHDNDENGKNQAHTLKSRQHGQGTSGKMY